jgi:hypothetical protein
MPLFLYRISQSKLDGYETYSDAVVCAESPEAARDLHPSGSWQSEFGKYLWGGEDYDPYEDVRYDWVLRPDTHLVKVEYLGVADSSIESDRVICASFHAG